MRSTNTQKSSNILGLIFLACISFFWIYRLFNDRHEEELLKNSKKTIAIIKAIAEGGYRNSPSATVCFFVREKTYEVELFGNYNDFQLKDTLLIEYAVEDPSVARLVDEYYMKKYQHLKD